MTARAPNPDPTHARLDWIADKLDVGFRNVHEAIGRIHQRIDGLETRPPAPCATCTKLAADPTPLPAPPPVPTFPSPAPETPTTRERKQIEIARARMSLREEQIDAELRADMKRTAWGWAKAIGALLVTAAAAYLAGRYGVR